MQFDLQLFASGLPNMTTTNQSTGLQQIVTQGQDNYASNNYGAAWATTATITADLANLINAPVNGDEVFLWNTATSTGRYYVYANNAWKNGSPVNEVT